MTAKKPINVIVKYKISLFLLQNCCELYLLYSRSALKNLMASTSKTTDSDLETSEDEINEQEPQPKPKKPLNMAPGAVKLRGWLNKTLRIKMSDGRVLIGVFLCTDRDANIILGSCTEYLPEEADAEQEGACVSNSMEEPRMLGLVMVPGKHIVNICIDLNENYEADDVMKQPLTPSVSADIT